MLDAYEAREGVRVSLTIAVLGAKGSKVQMKDERAEESVEMVALSVAERDRCQWRVEAGQEARGLGFIRISSPSRGPVIIGGMDLSLEHSPVAVGRRGTSNPFDLGNRKHAELGQVNSYSCAGSLGLEEA